MNLKEMKNIPVNIVADILGTSPQFIRIGLQDQRLPIGSAVQTSTQWTYHISYELLKNYVGKEKLDNYEKNFKECY